MSSPRYQLITPSDLDDSRKRASQITGVSWPELVLHDAAANEYEDELFDSFNELYPGGRDDDGI